MAELTLSIKKTYEEETLGIVTASKLKAFALSPRYYQLRYIELIKPEEKDDTDAMAIGTAFHYLMEHGMEEFLKKYHIEHSHLKAPYIETILQRYAQEGMTETDLASQQKRLEKLTLNELRPIYYGPKEWALQQMKIALTAGEGKAIVKMYERAVRQKQRDLGGKYSKEERVEAERKGLKIGMKPDRIVFYDRNKVRYTISEIQAMQEKEGLTDPQSKIDWAEKNGMTGMIRDFKTTADISKEKNSLIYQGDTKFAYMVSMAFYYTVVLAKFGIECQVMIDYIETRAPYITEIFSIPVNILQEKYNQIIRTTLQKILEAEQTGVYEEPTRDQILTNKDLRDYYDHFTASVNDEIFYLEDYL